MNRICYVAYRAYFQQRAADIFLRNKTCADIVVYTEEAVKALPQKGYLALLARGGTAEELRRMTDIPVVDIPVFFQDLAAALVQASRLGRKIGVVGYGNFLNHLNRLNPILDVELTQIIARTEEETRRAIVELHASGVEVLIGGMFQVEVAVELGMRAVLLDIYEDSLLDAYHQAETIVESSLLNTRKQEELRTILNTTRESFIAIDRERKITLANLAALRLSQAAQSAVVGQPLEAVFPAMTKLFSVMESRRECLREVLRIGTTDVLCDMFPLQTRDGQVVGAIATCNDAGLITESEHLLRNKLYGSGLYASYTFDQIVHDSQVIRDLIRTAKRYAASDASALILGESGVGKELFAQSIHNASDRRRNPFVAINCASIPDSILESELFGYEEGAFTGAKRSGKPGYFELAHKGTIFLDEIGEMPVGLQARLLRVLQEKRVMRLGGSQVIPIDVRIIAATNKDLERLIGQDRFRTDLFYRLNVLTLHVPPLRDRAGDIPILAEAYLNKHHAALCMTGEALEVLARQPWPGNIRQLYNFMERMCVVMETREVGARELRALLGTDSGGCAAVPALPRKSDGKSQPTRETLLAALGAHRGNRQEAADALGIHRSTLWRLLKKYDIVP